MSEKKASGRSTRFLVSFLSVAMLGGALGLSADHFYGSSTLSSSLLARATSATTTSSLGPEPEKPEVVHLPTPSPLRALYMTQCVVGTPSFRDELVELLDTTELNAVVIDIKDFSGTISFPSENPLFVSAVLKECGAYDMKEFIKILHEKGIYVIGRITAFQDPFYTAAHPDQAVKKLSATTTVWKDHKGLAFVDVGARPFWDYLVALGKESYELGFDELNFDYIRYPSDGNMKDIYYSWSEGKSRAEALEEFFRYLHKQLRPTGVVLSADLFGYTTVHQDDLGIGQILERTLPYFDFIYPMTYPSHYNSGFAGLQDVNSDPYKVIYASLVGALQREKATTTPQESFAFDPIASTSPQLYEKPDYSGKVVPWLQAFDYPVHYTPAMIQAQIQAAQDAGVASYLFWDASNKYTSLRQLLRQTAATTP